MLKAACFGTKAQDHPLHLNPSTYYWLGMLAIAKRLLLLQPLQQSKKVDKRPLFAGDHSETRAMSFATLQSHKEACVKLQGDIDGVNTRIRVYEDLARRASNAEKQEEYAAHTAHVSELQEQAKAIHNDLLLRRTDYQDGEMLMPVTRSKLCLFVYLSSFTLSSIGSIGPSH